MSGKISRYAIRVMAAASAVTIALLLFLNLLTMMTDIAPKAIVDIQRSNRVIGTLVALLSPIGPASMMLLWIVMLYHWRTHRFQSPESKKAWIVVLLVGNVLTALAYYFFVFELRWTLQVGQPQTGPCCKNSPSAREGQSVG